MLEFLQKLFLGHAHKWETFRRIRVMDYGDYVYDDYHQKCTVCGELKVTRL